MVQKIAAKRYPHPRRRGELTRNLVIEKTYANSPPQAVGNLHNLLTNNNENL